MHHQFILLILILSLSCFKTKLTRGSDMDMPFPSPRVNTYLTYHIKGKTFSHLDLADFIVTCKVRSQILVNELLPGRGRGPDADLSKAEAEVPEADLTKREADCHGKNRSGAHRRPVC